MSGHIPSGNWSDNRPPAPPIETVIYTPYPSVVVAAPQVLSKFPFTLTLETRIAHAVHAYAELFAVREQELVHAIKAQPDLWKAMRRDPNEDKVSSPVYFGWPYLGCAMVSLGDRRMYKKTGRI